MNTWTQLAATAEIGDRVITVQDSVADWRVDDHVLIVTTGGHISQGESEVFSIDAISDDGLSITLNDSLEYKHMGISETHGEHRPV